MAYSGGNLLKEKESAHLFIFERIFFQSAHLFLDGGSNYK